MGVAAFDRLVDEWCVYLGRRRRASTVVSYRAKLLSWSSWCAGRGLDPFDPCESEVHLWEGRVRRGGRAGSRGVLPSATTMKNDVVAWRCFYDWACKRNLVSCDPIIVELIEPREPVASVPRPVSDDEFWGFWLRPGWSFQVKAALGFAYFCGLRASEIGGLRADDVRVGDELVDGVPVGALSVVRKGGKEQVLPWLLTAEWICRQQVDAGWPVVRDAFDEWRVGVDRLVGRASRRGGWVFDWRLDRFGVPNVSNVVGDELRAGGEGVVRPHRLRHTFVTNMGRAGFSAEAVMSLVGHASVQTTMLYFDAAQVASEQLRRGPHRFGLTSDSMSVRVGV